jgi:CDP-paratose 2-epimerase
MRFLITGGAGFIGSNAARRFRELGHDVLVFDSFVRAASRFNRAWLESLHPDVQFIEGDIRDDEALCAALSEPFDVVLHLAGQVAVTTSIVDPVTDYEINALGTFKLLEELRRRHAGTPERAPLLIYASTNKVYGHLSMGDTIRNGRWDFQNLPQGVSEEEPLSFESPYGCSKGAADQ